LTGGAAHRAKTHLAQEIERVLVKQHDLRLDGLQCAFVLLQALRNHRIEKGYSPSRLSEHGRHLKRGERRIRLAALQLLLIQMEKIGVANQD
jgi:hypothetical protein